MNTDRLAQQKITWYRSPVTREQLLSLNERSDFKGAMQTGGFVGLVALTGSAAVYSAGRFPWLLVALLFFIHGSFWVFLLNGFHELTHNAVFKTNFLNGFFCAFSPSLHGSIPTGIGPVTPNTINTPSTRLTIWKWPCR